MTDPSLVLKTAIESYQYTQALKDGTVTVPGVSFDFVEVSPIHKAFKPMVERLEFDISEMAITTYLLARSFDKQLTALPVVLSRQFHHRSIIYNVKSGIREPKDLEGKRVGVRAYSQTTGVWVRGILHTEYGVDAGKVTWVTTEGAHIKEFRDPENVVRAPEGAKLDEMLLAREIDAAIVPSRFATPDIKPLIPAAPDVEAEWFRKTGIYPINHLVVVKSELAASHPALLGDLFYAFKAAKAAYFDRLYAEGPSAATEPDPSRPWLHTDATMLRLESIVGGDPWPYGIRLNRRAVETVTQYAFEQKLLPRPYSVEELFDPMVMDLE